MWPLDVEVVGRPRGWGHSFGSALAVEWFPIAISTQGPGRIRTPSGRHYPNHGLVNTERIVRVQCLEVDPWSPDVIRGYSSNSGRESPTETLRMDHQRAKAESA